MEVPSCVQSWSIDRTPFDGVDPFPGFVELFPIDEYGDDGHGLPAYSDVSDGDDCDIFDLDEMETAGFHGDPQLGEFRCAVCDSRVHHASQAGAPDKSERTAFFYCLECCEARGSGELVFQRIYAAGSGPSLRDVELPLLTKIIW